MELALYLAGGTVLMIGVMLLCNVSYKLHKGKTVLCAVLLTVCGFLGTKLMYLIENGDFGGQSFFGAIFFTPLLMLLVAKLLKLPAASVLDLSAPAESVMLALMKVPCLLTGCCEGKVLTTNPYGAEVRFPSQIVECAVALLLALLLYWLSGKPTLRGKLYPLYMVLYGATRFVLDLLRETTPFLLGLSAGCFWALISVAVGLVILGFPHRKALAHTLKTPAGIGLCLLIAATGLFVLFMLTMSYVMLACSFAVLAIACVCYSRATR